MPPLVRILYVYDIKNFFMRLGRKAVSCQADMYRNIGFGVS